MWIACRKGDVYKRQPIALLEAMSYDLPVIVSSIPANLEVGLAHDCYFQTGDELSLIHI